MQDAPWSSRNSIHQYGATTVIAGNAVTAALSAIKDRVYVIKSIQITATSTVGTGTVAVSHSGTGGQIIAIVNLAAINTIGAVSHLFMDGFSGQRGTKTAGTGAPPNASQDHWAGNDVSITTTGITTGSMTVVIEAFSVDATQPGIAYVT